MNKQNAILTVIVLLISICSFAQVKRTVVVEHFTNTYCSICASRNPSFKQNVANHPEVISITIHPSRPYRSCELHQHNPTDNDSRTNYYGILGGTPRIVVQGDVVSASTNYGSASIFDAYENNFTPYAVYFRRVIKTRDSLTAKIVITKMAEDSRTSLLLYVPAVEDTLNFAAPNGEEVHYNVLRKSLFNSSVQAPLMVGDSVEISVRTKMHPDWNVKQISAIAICQDEATKDILQASKSIDSASKEDETLSISYSYDNIDFSIYPNPSKGTYTISSAEIKRGMLVIKSLNGSILLKEPFNNQAVIDLSLWNKGMYFLTLESDKNVVTKKLLKR